MADKAKTLRILMIVENCSFVRDPRVRREARALYSAGHQVSVVCPGAEHGQPLREYIDGIAVYRYRPLAAGIKPLGYVLEYLYATLAIAVLSLVILMREGFDVIHLANPPDTMVLSVAPYRLIGKRIIYDQHDLCPELYAAKFARPSSLVFSLLLWLERWSYRLADHVITTNDSYKERALLRGHIPESKITVVRNGPSLRSISSSAMDPELRSKSKNIIVYAGTIGSQDGLDCLCRILHRLRYDLRREDFLCVVMGDGDALPQIKSLVQELQLESKFWFTGWIDDAVRYQRYLSTADICVSPDPVNGYNNRSTFIKIMEYMAAGKPIVTFDLLETRYSAQAAALYARADDEQQFAVYLTELMDQPALRHELGQRGQKRIREALAWEYSIPQLERAYAASLQTRRIFFRRCAIQIGVRVGGGREPAGVEVSRGSADQVANVQ
jgi:glycosyltransferase involved in cell wall biosynthesis